ncbi:MscL family protein [bacterium]|nr:MscL family protein [bacterium]
MAVGIVIGGAFGRIIASFVTDVLMPLIGMLLGNTDFTNLYAVLRAGATPGPYASLADAKTRATYRRHHHASTADNPLRHGPDAAGGRGMDDHYGEQPHPHPTCVQQQLGTRRSRRALMGGNVEHDCREPSLRDPQQ